MTAFWLYQIRAEPVLTDDMRGPLQTKEQRLCMLNFGDGTTIHTLPEPNNDIDQGDRRHLLDLNCTNLITVAIPEVSSWHVVLSIPTPEVDGLLTAAQQFTAYDPEAFTQPERTTPDKWHKPLSEPSEPDKGLHASLQQHLTWHTETPTVAEVITIDKWYRALEEPPSGVEPLPVGAKFFFTIDARQLTLPEETTPDKWWPRFADFVDEDPRVVEFLAYRNREAIAGDLEPPVTIDSWFQNLSTPTPSVEGLATAAQQVTAYDAEAFTKPEEVSVDRWLIRLSEPVLPLSYDAALAASGAVRGPDPTELAAPETITVDKWFKAFPDPPDEIPRSLASLYDQWAAQEALVFGENSWDNNEQAWDDSTTDWEGNETDVPEQIRWFKPLNEPTRPPFDPNKLGINHFFYVPEPILLGDSLDWYHPFPDPTELRDRGLPVALMPFFIMDAQLKLGFIGEPPVFGVWAAEGAAAGVWGAEGPASGSWTEEGPEC